MSDENRNEPSPIEIIKRKSRYLRGTIREGLENRITGSVSDDDVQLLKFHGMYQQDDRDFRNERMRQKLEPAYGFMVRVRVPGGVLTPAQWIVLDDLAHRYAGDTLRLTTRQTVQMHGIVKWNLPEFVQTMDRALLTSLAACGDINRNTMCSANPHQSEIHAQVYALASQIAAHLSPRTSAYHEIWIDGKRASAALNGGGTAADASAGDDEPIYGESYLPRKFKIAVAVPPSNDVDVFAHDLGFIAIVEDGRLAGFNVSVGGGMGMTYGEPETYPNAGTVIGFCRPEEAMDVAENVVLIQRDYGDRSNRKHARLKYTIDDRGIGWFNGQLTLRRRAALEPARPYAFTSAGDRFGWVAGPGDTWHLTVFVENGRIRDWDGYPLMSGLKKIAEAHDGEIRLTANQNIVIANVPARNKPNIDAIVAAHHLSDGTRHSAMRRSAVACVALPTCGLAMAEAERYLPELLTKIEAMLEEAGLRDEEIVVRMSGCPNGCSRPYLGEIGFTGKAPGSYNLYLGASHDGTRLNRMYRENIGEAEILETLRPMIRRYAVERQQGEHFGDFVVRAGYVRAVASGRDFHDDTSGARPAPLH